MDDDVGPATKRLKSDLKAKQNGVKKERSSKPAKTPKRRNVRSESIANSTMDSADRRKSGRSLSLKQTYADRDSSDDDKEMWDGAAEWDYFDEDGNLIAPPEEQGKSESDDRQDSTVGESPPFSNKQEDLGPLAQDAEDVDESEDMPTKRNGTTTKSKAGRTASQSKQTSNTNTSAKASSTAVREQLAPRRQVGKSETAAKSKGQTTKSTVLSKAKGKGKAKVKKDIYEMDTSD